MRPAIAYIRASTERQGRSGLGLEAQRGAIARFAEAEAYDLVETEIEGNLAVGGGGTVGAVRRVGALGFSEELADGSRRGLGWIGRAHHFAVLGEAVGYGWIPVAGPIIGGIIGALVYKAFSVLPPLS